MTNSQVPSGLFTNHLGAETSRRDVSCHFRLGLDHPASMQHRQALTRPDCRRRANIEPNLNTNGEERTQMRELLFTVQREAPLPLSRNA